MVLGYGDTKLFFARVSIGKSEIIKTFSPTEMQQVDKKPWFCFHLKKHHNLQWNRSQLQKRGF